MCGHVIKNNMKSTVKVLRMKNNACPVYKKDA